MLVKKQGTGPPMQRHGKIGAKGPTGKEFYRKAYPLKTTKAHRSSRRKTGSSEKKGNAEKGLGTVTEVLVIGRSWVVGQITRPGPLVRRAWRGRGGRTPS